MPPSSHHPHTHMQMHDAQQFYCWRPQAALTPALPRPPRQSQGGHGPAAQQPHARGPAPSRLGGAPEGAAPAAPHDAASHGPSRNHPHQYRVSAPHPVRTARRAASGGNTNGHPASAAAAGSPSSVGAGGHAT